MALFSAKQMTNLQKMNIYFKDMCIGGKPDGAWVPLLVVAGTNTAWADGIEIGKVKQAVRDDVPFFKDKEFHIYALAPEAGDTVQDADIMHPLWDEYVLYTTKKLMISLDELALPSSRASSNSEVLQGVDTPPVLNFSVKLQDANKWET
eukprot:1633339-Pyramimonas_sp.AAC.1